MFKSPPPPAVGAARTVLFIIGGIATVSPPAPCPPTPVTAVAAAPCPRTAAPCPAGLPTVLYVVVIVTICSLPNSLLKLLC